MKRVVLIGSSHTAAIQLGWRSLEDRYPDWSLCFYALPGKTFRKLQIDGELRFGALTPRAFSAGRLSEIRTALGGDSLDLRSTDAVVNIGWYNHEGEHAGILGNHSIDGVVETAGLPPLSRPAYEACVHALALHTLPKSPWLNWTAPHLFILPMPRPAESCLASENVLYDPWKKFFSVAPSGAALLASYADRTRSVLASNGVRQIDVPPSVLADSGMTRSEYARGAPKLTGDDQYPSGDHHHMNAAYGEIVLGHLLSEIATVLDSKE